MHRPVFRTRIKICGITRAEDAALAAEAGADAIGMVFHPASRRCISIEAAREIAGALPPFVTAVGLFVDQANSEIARSARAAGIRCVQLHGRETPRQVGELMALLPGIAVIKAIRAERQAMSDELKIWRQANAANDRSAMPSAFVLETANTAEPGGTGVENDWDLIRRAQDAGEFDGLSPIIAAGGLTPENVGAVVTLLHPWAVDVSSGVEGKEKGRKIPEKIKAFVAAVARADSGVV